MFVLVKPDVSELTPMRQLQAALQARCGGKPYDDLHVTVQRFRLLEAVDLYAVLARLETRLTPLEPLPLLAGRLVRTHHHLLQTDILRWEVEVTATGKLFADLVREGLVAAGVSPHLPDWRPHATALVEVPPGNNDPSIALHRPQQLFVARQVTVSQLLGQGQFRVVGSIPLNGVPIPT
jgi:hypothetical protein